MTTPAALAEPGCDSGKRRYASESRALAALALVPGSRAGKGGKVPRRAYECHLMRRLAPHIPTIPKEALMIDQPPRATSPVTAVTLRLWRLMGGPPTPLDGQWLVEYDPTRPGLDPAGRPMLAHIVTTPDRSRARVFSDAGAAMELWRAESGQPYPRNRPLTAWTVVVTRVCEPDVDPL